MIKIETFPIGLLETNCYVVFSTDTKIGYLIDPGIYDKRIALFIEKNGINILSIINTHGHADHTGALRRVSLRRSI